MSKEVRVSELVVKRVHYKLNLDGMSFLQMILFLKDIESPLVNSNKKTWQMAFDFFKATCQFHSKAKLSCDIFIEAVRKFRLIPSLKAVEVAMHDREIQIAAEMVAELSREGKSIPDFLIKTSARKKLKNHTTSFAEAANKLWKI